MILPADVKAILETRPEALQFYEELAYSHRKEYILWILTAKQEKTRTDRIHKMLEKLLNNKKNPGEK
ncbi:Bacteriocin-protection, YdeI or OmpD-Associated [compost metagenome]